MQRYRNFAQAVEAVIEKHPEYDEEAYHHIMKGMNKAQEHLAGLEENGKPRHLTAEELYFGCCACALEEYGPLASKVLEYWGLNTSSDIGKVVYNLIEVGVFGKQKGDKLSEFDTLPNMQDLLNEPFSPKTQEEKPKKKRTPRKKKTEE